MENQDDLLIRLTDYYDGSPLIPHSTTGGMMKNTLVLWIAFVSVTVVLASVMIHFHHRLATIEQKAQDASVISSAEDRFNDLESRIDEGEKRFTRQLEQLEKAIEFHMRTVTASSDRFGSQAVIDEDFWNQVSDMIHEQINRNPDLVKKNDIDAQPVLEPLLRTVGRRFQEGWINQIADAAELTDDQKKEVEQIFQDRMNGIAELWQEGGDPEEARQRMHDLREETNRRLQDIMDPDQFERLNRLREERRPFFLNRD
jgi:hypothetical protein